MRSSSVRAVLLRLLFLVLAIIGPCAAAGLAAGENKPAISQSFFPTRPPHIEIHFRTGVLIEYGVGNKSGSATIRDAAGRTYRYFLGSPLNINGRQIHCASPIVPGVRFDRFLCESGWPVDVVIGVTRVRVYYWHAVSPRAQDVVVTDTINRVP